METLDSIERLEQLIRVARGVDPEQFDMESWTDHNDCGTTHCIGGWMAVDTWWKIKTEISEIFVNDRNDFIYPALVASGDTEGLKSNLATLMGITRGEASYLFGITRYLDGGETIDTLEDVIRYVELLIERKKQELPCP